jgi:hypothetical protein
MHTIPAAEAFPSGVVSPQSSLISQVPFLPISPFSDSTNTSPWSEWSFLPCEKLMEFSYADCYFPQLHHVNTCEHLARDQQKWKKNCKTKLLVKVSIRKPRGT